MGELSFDSGVRTDRREPGGSMAPIGEVALARPVECTLLYPDAAGRYVLGEEIPGVLMDDTDRSFLRVPLEGETPRVCYCKRQEIRFEKAVLASYGLSAGARLVRAQWPYSRQVVHDARLQMAFKEGKKYWTHYIDTLPPEGTKARYNPLGLSEANLQQRLDMDDMEAARWIAERPSDIYLSDKQFLRASFVEHASKKLAYDDLEVELPIDIAVTDKRYYGIVQDMDVALRQVSDELLKRVERSWRRIEETGLLGVKPGQKVSIDAKKIGDPLEIVQLALRQSLAGAGGKSAKYKGKPVSELAYHRFMDHVALRNRQVKKALEKGAAENFSKDFSEEFAEGFSKGFSQGFARGFAEASSEDLSTEDGYFEWGSVR